MIQANAIMYAHYKSEYERNKSDKHKKKIAQQYGLPIDEELMELITEEFIYRCCQSYTKLSAYIHSSALKAVEQKLKNDQLISENQG